MNKIVSVCGLFLMVNSFASHADSFLRIKCDDKDAGTEVFINGKLVGECPLDAPAPEGTVQLRARKVLDADHEQLFDKQLKVIEGVPQRVELIMSAPQLTAEAIHRKEVEAARAQLSAAEAGDIAAMKELARRYGSGNGVPQDETRARAWNKKAAETEAAAEAAAARQQLQAAQAGNVQAMDDIANRYETGKGLVADPAQAKSWRDKATSAKQQKATQELAQRKQAEKEAKLKKHSFIGFTKEILDPNNPKAKELPSSYTLAWTYLPVWLATDLVSAPSRSTELYNIHHDASLRPSTWGKPDSMIARAWNQDKASSSAEDHALIAQATE